MQASFPEFWGGAYDCFSGGGAACGAGSGDGASRGVAPQEVMCK